MTICELSPGLWFGQLHPGEQLLTAKSAAECSHSPHRIIHQPRKTLGRENMLPPKICMTDSSKAWLQFIGSTARSTSSICTPDGADCTSTSKGEVKSLKSSLYSILLNNLSLLRCHGYLGSDKRRATEASDWSLLISAAYQHPRMSYRPRELIDCYYVSFNTPTQFQLAQSHGGGKSAEQ